MAIRALAAAPPRFIAMGLSMGGIVALEIARTTPERLAGIALIDTMRLPTSPIARPRGSRISNACWAAPYAKSWPGR